MSLIAFVFLYKPLNYYISDYVEVATGRAKEKTYSSRKDEMTIRRLKDISTVFKELSETFKSSAGNNRAYDGSEVYELIDNVCNTTCSNCGMRKFCWEEGFYTTYYSLFNMVGMMEENITLTDDNLPPQLIRDYCINKMS